MYDLIKKIFIHIFIHIFQLIFIMIILEYIDYKILTHI